MSLASRTLKRALLFSVISIASAAFLGGIMAQQANAATCPCSIWPSGIPATAATNDPAAVELGVKFTADRPGLITGIRFYKGTGNNGTHIGNLWTAGGTNLATATFSNETATGWQQADFPTPVVINASTTYVASYFAPTGFYANTGNYFATSFSNSPLHTPDSASSGGNGLYRYGSASGFPSSTFNATNYWVDVIFADLGSTSVPVIASFTANPSSITQGQSSTLSWSVSGASSMSIDQGVGTVTGTSVSVSPAATTTYTLTATNSAGSATSSATVTVSPVPPPAANPILIITAASNPFTKYYGEILNAEGFNEYSTADISAITPAVLGSFDEVILGDMPLSAAQVTMFSDWVTGGGNLVAMRPDKQLAGLLGITDAAGTRADAYMGIDTTQAPGQGIVADTIQYHGAADLYTVSGARAVAFLYSNASTATANPAVTVRTVGSGQVAAFTFDLARSVVYTRQGNPAWAGQERDNDAFGVIRSDDLFFPDYLDLNKVAIPQADEMQRLLGNILTQMSAASNKAPLPHFWYFPSMHKAVIVAAGDDHATSNGTQTVFDQFLAASPAGCSVADWECYRATSWIYAGPLSAAAANQYYAQGFDIGVHVNNGCANYASQAALDSSFTSELNSFQAQYPGLPPQIGNRTHCAVWSDWASMPKVELAHGIRFDMGYYYWPGTWIQNRPGFMNGSGIPMRYADIDGTPIDVYQQATHMVDENGESWPAGANARVSAALGPQGYYGAFGTHFDYNGDGFESMLLSVAQTYGIPLVSAQQMLTWVDARNASSFSSLSWNGSDVLTFTVTASGNARNLYALLPQGTTPISSITRNGSPVSFSTSTIKGVSYAVFPAQSGAYTATYSVPQPDTTTPTAPSSLTASAVSASQINLAWTASTDNVGVTGYQVFRDAVQVATSTGTSFSDTGLAASTTYGYTVRAFDAAGNVSASSNTASATTLFVDTIAPSAPTGLAAAAVSSSQINLTWTASTDNVGVTGYRVFRDGVLAGSPAGTSYSDTNLTASTTYSYTVKAFDAASNVSAPSSPASATTFAAPAQNVNIAPAGTAYRWSKNSSALLNSNRVAASGLNDDNLTADVHLNGGVAESAARYEAGGVIWSTDQTVSSVSFVNGTWVSSGDGGYSANLALQFTTDGTTWVNSGWTVSPSYPYDSATVTGQTYTFSGTPVTVRGVRVSGQVRTTSAGSYWENMREVQAYSTPAAPDTTAPTAPSSLTASAVSASQINLAWTASTDNIGVTGYKVFRDAVQVATSTGTSFSDTGLAASTTYGYTVQAFDAAGNVSASSNTANATTQAASQASYSLWSATSTPTNPSDSDTASVELGVKFTSDIAGKIYAIRFYKGMGNTGTHVAHLWSSAGTLMGAATSSSETASGWQQFDFATPISISAGTTYVASYLAPNGHYAGDNNYFGSALNAGILHAPSSAASGGNGVYAYTASPSGAFPSSSWLDSNYWVDVVFKTN